MGINSDWADIFRMTCLMIPQCSIQKKKRYPAFEVRKEALKK